MADTFFGFNTSSNRRDNISSPNNDDGLEEEEYDALNDETFGGFGEDTSDLDDWEQRHEEFAEFAEHSKQSEEIENSISKLVFDEHDAPNLSKKDSVWAYTSPTSQKNGDIINVSLLHILEKSIDSSKSSSTNHHTANATHKSSASTPLHHLQLQQQQQHSSAGRAPPPPPSSVGGVSMPEGGAGGAKKICTVEELERDLMMGGGGGGSNRAVGTPPKQGLLQGVMGAHHPMFGAPGGPPPPGGAPRLPPGLHPSIALQHQQQQHHFRHMMAARGGAGPGPGPGPPPHHYMRLPPGVQPPPPGAQQGPGPGGYPGLGGMYRGGQPPPPGITYPPMNHHLGHHHPYPHPPPPHPYGNVNPLPPGSGPPPRPPPPGAMYNNNHHHNQNGPGPGPGPGPVHMHQGNNVMMHQQQQHQRHMMNHSQQQQQHQMMVQQQMGQHMMNHQQNQRPRRDSSGGGNYGRVRRESGMDDEYAGLMSNREKQWLLNIQLLQLNTETPYFDDYYYTIFKERKTERSENQNHQRFNQYNNKRENNRNNDRQENSNPLATRVYVPLQFENSLGKLQYGSVTAPRKIIDTDLLQPADSDSGTSRDLRKTKQLLLELEALYTLLLKAEDLRNPLALKNVETLRELKQKQRLRELDAAPTPDQKQEVLKLLRAESEPPTESPIVYVTKVVQGLLQEDKVHSFLNIRKGKMLLLRLLPHLTPDQFMSQLGDVWLKVLLSIPSIGRRDTAGDNILPQLHPFFKRYVQNCKMSHILRIVSNLVEVVKQESNSRSTPLSHQGKSPLHFVIGNKLGVSALVTLLTRTEYLITSANCISAQLTAWNTFIVQWAELTSHAAHVATPLDPIPRAVYTKHMQRVLEEVGWAVEEGRREAVRAAMERYYVDDS